MMPSEERIDYYRNENVRARIVEFLGGNSLQEPTCRYLIAGNESRPCLDQPHAACMLESLLDEGLEINRSLWDKTFLLADFDVEYVNFDHADAVFVEPERILELQQPLAEVIERTLSKYLIRPLHVLSGRGHHFVWRVRRDSAEFRKLAQVGRGPPSLWAIESEPHPPNDCGVPAELAHAFAGLGLVMEFLAHQIKRCAARLTQIPIELTAIEVGPSAHGREMISIDLSEYGDPLHARMIRVPFSVYLKPWQQSWAFAPDVLEHLPTVFVIPLHEMTWREGMRTMRDAAAVTKVAETCCTKIPDATQSMAELISDYEKSSLARFHNWFYSQEQHEPAQWKETYDRLALEILPGCARMVLEHPNDLLLRPGNIRRLVRVMLALGWHPRHIAGLIHSKYARPFGWTQFRGCDPATRADFYTRIFSGAFATGYDDLIDFNCVSAQEQHVCSFANCGFNLLDFRQSALNRRANEKLAHRPFNRLLLQPEHP
jgi:hypothetical protein